MLDVRKLLLYCFCCLLVLATWAQAGNVIANGSFDTSSSGWGFYVSPSASGLMHADYDAGVGNPAGSVKCWIDVNETTNNDHRFYQVMPVNIGQKYKLDAQWKGNLYGKADVNPSSRNWAEVFVSFCDDPEAPSWGLITYKKAFTGGPNTDTGIWDWESILSSPDPSNPSAPGDGVFTATDRYMVVAINLGGRANSVEPGKEAWVYVDNFRLLPCHDESCSDYSADFKYLAWITSNWLSCNIDPPTSCY